MSQIIKIQGASSSNKPGEVELILVAYFLMGGKVAVLKPQIDRISLTYRIEDEDLLGALIEALLNPDDHLPIKPVKKFKSGGLKYKAEVQLTAPNGQTVLMQAGPKKMSKKGHNFRIEFNPSKLGADGLEYLRKILLELVVDGLSLEAFFKGAKVTRIDFAVDLLGVKPDQLLVALKSGGTSHFYVLDAEIQTVLFGLTKTTKKLNCPLMIYNKRKEGEAKGAASIHGGASCARVEIRVRPERLFSNLLSMKNPLVRASVCYPSTGPSGVKKHYWTFFISRCVQVGQERALQEIPEGKSREKFREALVSAQKELWRPEILWIA